MKRTFMLTTLSVIGSVLLLSSCGTSRVWETKDKSRREPPPTTYRSPYGPASYVSAPLIITPSPGFRMSQFSDGRFFHRSQQGILYWKGYDNRFYMDRNYVNRVSYSKWEYKQWKKFSKSNRG